MIRSIKTRFLLYGIGLTWLVGGIVATVGFFVIDDAIREETDARVEEDVKTALRLFRGLDVLEEGFRPLTPDDHRHVRVIAGRASPDEPAIGCAICPGLGMCLITAKAGTPPLVRVRELRGANWIPDRLRDMIFKEDAPEPTVTIFEGRRRIATNVRTAGGERAIDTLVSDSVAEAVLDRGEVWKGRAYVVNRWMITCYLTIRDPDGAVIGMLYAGLDEEPYLARGRRILGTFLLTILGVTILTSLLAALVGRGIARPLIRLNDATRALAAGEYRKIEKTAVDEVGALTDTFNLMIERVLERTAELTASRAEAQQALADYLDVLAFVAHELRHPVAGGLSKLALIEKGYVGEVPEKMQPVIARVRRYLDYGLEISESFNYLSRAETTGFTVRPTDHEDVFAALVWPVVGDWQDAATERGMEIRVDGEGGAVTLDTDLGRIALGNLVGNAVKYGEEKSPIHVVVERGEGDFRISVTNRGVGIAEDRYGDLFAKFSRLKDEKLADRRGTGIGLFLVRRIAEAHGGSVGVDGEHGEWVRFTLILPAHCGPA